VIFNPKQPSYTLCICSPGMVKKLWNQRWWPLWITIYSWIIIGDKWCIKIKFFPIWAAPFHSLLACLWYKIWSNANHASTVRFVNICYITWWSHIIEGILWKFIKRNKVQDLRQRRHTNWSWSTENIIFEGKV